MAEYDTISKHLIQTYPDDFVRFTLQRDDVAVRRAWPRKRGCASAFRRPKPCGWTH